MGALFIIALAATTVSAATYTVRYGDSLYLIAKKYGVTVSAIKAANGLQSDVIYPGQVLSIPSSGGSSTRYTVRSGDTLYLIAQRYGTTVSAIMSANGLWSSTIYPGQSSSSLAKQAVTVVIRRRPTIRLPVATRNPTFTCWRSSSPRSLPANHTRARWQWQPPC